MRSQRELLDASTPSPQASAALPDLDVDANELALVYRARGMAPAEAEEHAADVLATYTQQTVIAPPPGVDEHETHGTAMGRRSRRSSSSRRVRSSRSCRTSSG